MKDKDSEEEFLRMGEDKYSKEECGKNDWRIRILKINMVGKVNE